jgi:hypothetical protein
MHTAEDLGMHDQDVGELPVGVDERVSQAVSGDPILSAVRELKLRTH